MHKYKNSISYRMTKYMELKMQNYITILRDQIEILKHFNRKVTKLRSTFKS